jgi:hypothetical protein
MSQWTKEEAIDRVEADQLVAESVRMEPRLLPLINEARAQQAYEGYSRVRTYYALKARAYALVGYEAERPELRTPRHYDAVLGAIEWLLPPDSIDRMDSGEEPDEVEEP